jgi:ketosteroid isomerase-like protein
MRARTPEQCNVLLNEAIHRGDVDAAVSFYEQHATFVLESGAIVTGQVAIREVVEGLMALKQTLTLEGKALLSGDGDLALTSATWSSSRVDAEGRLVTESGKSIEVVRRQADGTWRIVIDHPHGGE